MKVYGAVSRLSGAGMLVAAAVATALYVVEHAAWRTVVDVAAGVLAVRLAVMVWGAARRALPWTRLGLPALVLLGLGVPGVPARLGVAIVVELAIVVVVIGAIRAARLPGASGEPLEARLARGLEAIVPPRIARLAALEVVLVGAGLRFLAGGWRRPVPAGFTYHRESGLRMFLAALPLLVLGDVALIELVILPRAAPWVRVLVHVLAVYGVIWIVGLYATVRARPHRLAGGELVLHRGALRRLVVPASDVVSIAPLPSFGDDWERRAYCKGALRLDVAGAPVLELRLRDARRVLVAVDDPEAFAAAVRASGGEPGDRGDESAAAIPVG